MSTIVQWATNLPSGYVSQTMLVIIDGIDSKIVPSLDIVSKRFEPHLKLICKRYADYNTKEKCVIYLLRISYIIDHFGESEVGKCVIKIYDRNVEIKGVMELDCEDTRIKSVELPLIREAIQSYKLFIQDSFNEIIRKLNDQMYQEQKMNAQPKAQTFEDDKMAQMQQKVSQPIYNVANPLQEKMAPQPALNLQSPQNQTHVNAIDPKTLKNAISRMSEAQNGIFVTKKDESQIAPRQKETPKENPSGDEIDLENISKDDPNNFPKPKVPNRAFQVRVPDLNSLKTSNT